MSRTKRNARITAVEAAERDKAVAPKQRAEGAIRAIRAAIAAVKP